MAEEPALCQGVSVPLPERFGLNIFRSRRCPFGTQLNEFSRVFAAFSFKKDPENRVSSLVSARTGYHGGEKKSMEVFGKKMNRMMQNIVHNDGEAAKS